MGQIIKEGSKKWIGLTVTAVSVAGFCERGNVPSVSSASQGGHCTIGLVIGIIYPCGYE